MKTKRPLTPSEQEALAWVRRNYRHWRTDFTETREQHAARIPAGMKDYPDAWAGFYDRPFGRQDWNDYIAAVRRLLADGAV